MFQVNASLAIIMSFLITFVDEIGEIKELDMKKTVLIVISLIVGFLIYKNSNDNEATQANLEVMKESEMPKNLLPLKNKVEGFKNYSYI